MSNTAKTVMLVVVAITVFLCLGGVAFAYTAEDIYDDYADNGRLDNTYTDDELGAYLTDPTMHQYGDSETVSELDSVVRRMLGLKEGEYPFTGAQLALMVVGAAALVGIGVGIRRLARPKGPKA